MLRTPYDLGRIEAFMLEMLSSRNQESSLELLTMRLIVVPNILLERASLVLNKGQPSSPKALLQASHRQPRRPNMSTTGSLIRTQSAIGMSR